MSESKLDEAVEVALDALDAACLNDEGRKVSWIGYTRDDREAAMRAALLAGVKVLLGEPVAWMCDAGDGINRDATASAHVRDTYARVGRMVTDLYAPSLGEGDGR